MDMLLSRDSPVDSSSSFRFSKMRRASLVTVPCWRSPLCGSIATMPEQKTIPPARIAGLW